MPSAMALTIPMALLLGLLVAFGRLSADREFVAMQACGVSRLRLLRPVGVLSALGWGATTYILLVAVPDANQRFREITFGVVAARAEGEVRPRTFFEDFPDPLGGYYSRWRGQNTNLNSYDICDGDPNPDNRGNNPCGMWICDGSLGTPDCDILFSSFGDDIELLEFDLSVFCPITHVQVFDKDGASIFDSDIADSPDVCNGTPVSIPSANGVSRLLITQTTDTVEGWTGIDNVHVRTNDGPVSIDSESWTEVKGRYHE